MAYNQSLALELLKGRMDRAGLDVPPNLEAYWSKRLEAAVKYLKDKGVVFDNDTESIADNELVADYTAYKLTNRDSTDTMPKWLRLEIRERFLKGSGG